MLESDRFRGGRRPIEKKGWKDLLLNQGHEELDLWAGI